MYYVSKSIWLTSSAYPGSNYLAGIDAHNVTTTIPLSLNPIPSSTSWLVAKVASGSYASMTSSATATVFSTAVKPDGGLSTTIGEGFIFGPYTGVFPLTSAATMSLSMSLYATTINSQAGLVRFRIWKCATLAAGSPVLISGTTSRTNISTVTAATNRIWSGSFALTQSVTMNNEYLVVEVAWGITTTGGNNNCNVIFRAGSGSRFTTGPFEDNTCFITGGEDAGYIFKGQP